MSSMKEQMAAIMEALNMIKTGYKAQFLKQEKGYIHILQALIMKGGKSIILIHRTMGKFAFFHKKVFLPVYSSYGRIFRMGSSNDECGEIEC